MAQSKSRSEFRVPTYPVEARLVLLGGREEEVILYLGTAAETHPGPESLDEFLNHPRQFLPVKSRPSGKCLLVRRESIQRVEVGEGAPILCRMQPDLASFVDLVHIEMLDSAVLAGTLAFVLPPENTRTSDYFNLQEGFFPLELEERVAYVNKRHVLIVWL